MRIGAHATGFRSAKRKPGIRKKHQSHSLSHTLPTHPPDVFFSPCFFFSSGLSIPVANPRVKRCVRRERRDAANVPGDGGLLSDDSGHFACGCCGGSCLKCAGNGELPGWTGAFIHFFACFFLYFFSADAETDKQGKRKFRLLIGARIFSENPPPKKGNLENTQKSESAQDCFPHFFYLTV